MERIRQTLEYLAVRHRDKLDTPSLKQQPAYLTETKANLTEIINELERLETAVGSGQPSSRGLGETPATIRPGSGGSGSSGNSMDGLTDESPLSHHYSGNSLEARLLHHNKEMVKTIKKTSAEKAELKHQVARLEEEIWNYKNKYKNEINSLTEHDREKVNMSKNK